MNRRSALASLVAMIGAIVVTPKKLWAQLTRPKQPVAASRYRYAAHQAYASAYLQSFVDEGGDRVYWPAGEFVLDRKIRIRPRQVVYGANGYATKISACRKLPPGGPVREWFECDGQAAIRGCTFTLHTVDIFAKNYHRGGVIEGITQDGHDVSHEYMGGNVWASGREP